MSRKEQTKAPAQNKQQSPQGKGAIQKRQDYGSDGVTDNDIFLLPGSDLQLMLLLTLLAAVVRLFRIYQPPSVVFDEVQ